MTTGTRTVRHFEHRVSAPPQVVFPLLCPVREVEWIPGWTCEVVYSESGVAELDGVFVAGLESAGRARFFVQRYEPPRAIDYLVLGDEPVADRLSLALDDDGHGGTRLHWRRMFTALTPEGIALVERKGAAFESRVPKLAELLERHVTSR